ncbi:MAG: PAS domain-containing sensor histidine kinase [Deltaproteobacteria bacterium]|jgi:PAS domain S-box-containing protein|nr:PAS domain-containing sensor histidine kinase [Deltaproteobacteria bacterium]
MLSDTIIAFCNALRDPLALTDTLGRVVMINPAFRDLLVHGPEESEPLQLFQLMPEHRRRDQVTQLQACLRGENIVSATSELETRDGRRVPVRLTLSLFHQNPDAEPLVVWTFKPDRDPVPPLVRKNLILENEIQSKELVIDHTVNALEAEVSERREVEKELEMSRRQLRMLSQKTLELLESDRQMIAKELHDSIGASLAAIKFSLEGWLEMYGEQLPSNEIPFDRIITHIMETIKETKRISANLRPTTLDDLGLLATAQWFCRNLAGLYQGIRITPRFDVSEADIPEAMKIVVYRVMQEALSNAAKHGQAQNISVSLILIDGHLELTVTDDGCGFDRESVMGTEDTLSGFGINSMRERVEICDGRFDIRTRIGEGTRIHASLPVGSGSAAYRP